MISQNTVSRRQFFKKTLLASGGLLIGFNLFEACRENVEPPIDLTQLDYNDFNAFIQISKEGKVSIFAPNPEIGQGVKTAMPMLVAEELDVPWKDVLVVQAPLDTQKYTRQLAGGSQSIRLAWEPLRQSGATARQMLVNAAAAQWGVEASACKTENGTVIGPDGQKLGYGDVVVTAAQLPVPETYSLKDPKDFKVIGTDVVNVDIDKIITGKPLFGLDYKQEGMLYAAILRPPAFGQELESFDATAAKNVPGVEQVVTIGEKARSFMAKEQASWTVKLSQSDKIAVVATSTWAAFKGLQALKAEWKTVTPLESSVLHNEELDKILHGENLSTRRSDGDVKKAFADADTVLERTYEAPFLPHNTLEPMNFYADVNTEKIQLVGPVQTPEDAAKVVASMLDRNLNHLHVEMTRMGGGFGRRLYGDFVYEAAELSHLLQKPVKIISAREHDMATGVYRPASKYHIKAAIKDSKVTAYHLTEACVGGNMYGLIPNFFPANSIPNYQVDTGSYNSNITTGAWRAPYTNFLASAEQSFFDELAETMKVDRVQLHMDLLEEAKAHVEDERMEYSPERLQGVLKKVVEMAQWGQVPEDVHQGLSVYYCHNTHVAEIADVVLENGYPIVKKVYCAVDCGMVINPTGAKNQVVGGILDGIGHMMYGELTFEEGMPQSTNFDKYQLLRINQTPLEVDVAFIENTIAPTGLGEPTLPPVGAAVANAIYKATGQRLYKQPYMRYFEPKELAV